MTVLKPNALTMITIIAVRQAMPAEMKLKIRAPHTATRAGVMSMNAIVDIQQVIMFVSQVVTIHSIMTVPRVVVKIAIKRIAGKKVINVQTAFRIGKQESAQTMHVS